MSSAESSPNNFNSALLNEQGERSPRKCSHYSKDPDKESSSHSSIEEKSLPNPVARTSHPNAQRLSDVSHSILNTEASPGNTLLPPAEIKKETKSYSLEALAGLSADLPADRRAHLAITGKQLLHAWRNNKFCDIIIKADHTLFYAHLEVFVAFTDYFEDIPAERKEVHINLGQVKPDDAATVLKYLYFGELQANAENIYGVWMIAKALRVHDIEETCATFIERLLVPRNLVHVLEFCEAKQIGDLYAAAYDRFILMFYEQTMDDAFLQWDLNKVVRLLGCDDIKIKTEMDVYSVMKLWIDHRRPERMLHLEVLVEYIRFAHMTRDEIVQCTLMDPSFLEVRKVKELLATANWYITMQQSGRHWSEFQLPKPRHPPRKTTQEASSIIRERPAKFLSSGELLHNTNPIPIPRTRRDTPTTGSRKSMA